MSLQRMIENKYRSTIESFVMLFVASLASLKPFTFIFSHQQGKLPTCSALRWCKPKAPYVKVLVYHACSLSWFLTMYNYQYGCSYLRSIQQKKQARHATQGASNNLCTKSRPNGEETAHVQTVMHVFLCHALSCLDSSLLA